MRSRAVVLVAVVGALLVGGATTGTTYATWRDQAAAGSGALQSGNMALTASGPAGLTVARGTTGTALVTVSDASSAQAKNLVQRLTPTVPGPLPSGVSATLTTRSGSTCTATPQGAVVTGPSGSFVTCLNVSATAGASTGSTTVTVAVAGRQLRSGAPAGWTATDQTVSVPVTVTAGTPAPAAPVLSCVSQSGTGVTWTTTGTSYHVYETADVATWSPTPVLQGTTATTFDRGNQFPTGSNATRWYRVVAVNAGGSSTASNVIKVSRNGNSSNFTCGAP